MRCGTALRTVREAGHARRRCPTCGFTFYDNPVPATVAILERGGRILLARRARPPYAGTWDLPGGFLEAGESPEQGLRREVREELGLETRQIRLWDFATDWYGRGGFPVLALIYRITTAPGEPRAADDVSEARWFSRAQLPLRDVGFPSMRRALRIYVSGKVSARRNDRVRAQALPARPNPGGRHRKGGEAPLRVSGRSRRGRGRSS